MLGDIYNYLYTKIVNMMLIYIRSTMEPKNYSTIRSILKKEQGEKIAPYIFKLADTKSLQTYLMIIMLHCLSIKKRCLSFEQILLHSRICFISLCFSLIDIGTR